jgi:hypothetical protein
MIGHGLSDNCAADSANDEAHRAANDRPTNPSSNGASNRAILIRHGGRGQRERRDNGGRR